MADREKKGKTKIQKFEYLKNEKNLMKQKTLFIVFEEVSFGEM